jgi:hypothetical protein
MPVYVDCERSPGEDLYRLRREHLKFMIVGSLPTGYRPKMADQFLFAEIAKHRN